MRSVLGSAGASIALVLTMVACKGPVTSPEELAKVAASARAALSAGAFVPPDPSSAPPPAPLVPQAFKEDVPSALCSPVTGSTCALDVLADKPASDVMTVKRDSSPTFVGWAADGDLAPPVVVVELVGAKKFFAPASRITKRPDVAAAKKAPALVDSGYDLIGVLANVAPGTYAVHVLQVDVAGNSVECDTRRQLKVE